MYVCLQISPIKLYISPIMFYIFKNKHKNYIKKLGYYFLDILLLKQIIFNLAHKSL